MQLKLKSLACAVVLSVVSVTSAFAGPYSNNLGQCLVQKTTPEDHMLLIQWVFSAIAAHPNMKEFSTLTKTQTKGYDEGMSKLLMRLLTKDCRKELKEAYNHEGQSAIESSFQTLGAVAMENLMQDGSVQNQMMGFLQYMDESKLQEVLK